MQEGERQRMRDGGSEVSHLTTLWTKLSHLFTSWLFASSASLPRLVPCAIPEPLQRADLLCGVCVGCCQQASCQSKRVDAGSRDESTLQPPSLGDLGGKARPLMTVGEAGRAISAPQPHNHLSLKLRASVACSIDQRRVCFVLADSTDGLMRWQPYMSRFGV